VSKPIAIAISNNIFCQIKVTLPCKRLPTKYIRHYPQTNVARAGTFDPKETRNSLFTDIESRNLPLQRFYRGFESIFT